MGQKRSNDFFAQPLRKKAEILFTLAESIPLHLEEKTLFKICFYLFCLTFPELSISISCPKPRVKKKKKATTKLTKQYKTKRMGEKERKNYRSRYLKDLL